MDLVMNVGMDKEWLRDKGDIEELEPDFPLGCYNCLHCIICMNLWILWTYQIKK